MKLSKDYGMEPIAEQCLYNRHAGNLHGNFSTLTITLSASGGWKPTIEQDVNWDDVSGKYQIRMLWYTSVHQLIFERGLIQGHKRDCMVACLLNRNP